MQVSYIDFKNKFFQAHRTNKSLRMGQLFCTVFIQTHKIECPEVMKDVDMLYNSTDTKFVEDLIMLLIDSWKWDQMSLKVLEGQEHIMSDEVKSYVRPPRDGQGLPIGVGVSTLQQAIKEEVQPPKHYVAYLQEVWESEAGWGQKPDGMVLALDVDKLKTWATSSEGGVICGNSDYYCFVRGTPTLVKITAIAYAKLKSQENNIIWTTTGNIDDMITGERG